MFALSTSLAAVATPQEHGQTSLIVATYGAAVIQQSGPRRGHIDIVRLLLEARAETDQETVCH